MSFVIFDIRNVVIYFVPLVTIFILLASLIIRVTFRVTKTGDILENYGEIETMGKDRDGNWELATKGSSCVVFLAHS